MSKITSIWTHIDFADEYVDGVKYVKYSLYADATFEYLNRTYSDCIKIKDVLTVTYDNSGNITSVKKADISDITKESIDKSIGAVVDNHVEQIKFMTAINTNIKDITDDIVNQTEYNCNKPVNKYL